ncbi:MAG TPA: 30S ribosomal protein S4e [Candidatus Nitrosotenuis sp.]|nr:30S ribosomal protein S4e [Candidatus Nitrosotenuis sp.]
MTRIAGSKKLKRQMAPMFWGISRKSPRFVTTVKPGPHSKHFSIPTAVFLRDTIKIVTTAKEAYYAIYNGKVKIDGIKRKSIHHGIGLMDVIELEGVKDIYRLVPKSGHILEPIKINSSEKAVKLVKVTSKTTMRKGKNQIGFHDGRTLLSDEKVSVGDSCLMQVPEQKINDVLKLKEGVRVLVTNGINAGQIGEVKGIKKGTFVLPKRVLLLLGEKEIEIPANLVMVVGNKEPVIQVA